MKALVALGSNLEIDGKSPDSIVRTAISRLSDAVGDSAPRISRFYRTAAFPPGSGPDFVNAVVAFDWTGEAEALLALLHRLEADLGRTRRLRWEARVLDLDLLALGDRVHPDAETVAAWQALTPEEAAARSPEGLILPHPRLRERGFVLVPLADVAPDWRHPLTGESVTDLLQALPAGALEGIVPIDENGLDRGGNDPSRPLPSALAEDR